jgi:hypothetical protein
VAREAAATAGDEPFGVAQVGVRLPQTTAERGQGSKPRQRVVVPVDEHAVQRESRQDVVHLPVEGVGVADVGVGEVADLEVQAGSAAAAAEASWPKRARSACTSPTTPTSAGEGEGWTVAISATVLAAGQQQGLETGTSHRVVDAPATSVPVRVRG